MNGNIHVQFLGEGVAATSPPYPTPGWATTQVYPAQGRPRAPRASVGEILIVRRDPRIAFRVVENQMNYQRADKELKAPPALLRDRQAAA